MIDAKDWLSMTDTVRYRNEEAIWEAREFFLAGKGQRNQKGAENDGGPPAPAEAASH
jgi:hypothetical protein